MKNLSILILLLSLTTISYSQSKEDKEKAHNLCMMGIAEMDKGEIEHALKYFEQAKQLDSYNYFYPYEIAHSYYLIRHYKKAIEHLEVLLQHKDVTDRAYHLLGSSYEHSGNITKAIEIFQKGIVKFPASGVLYNELGNLYMRKHNYPEALSSFEKGIEADPTFSSNYYWASKLHASMEDKLWGIMYAELFINMEGITDKSHELSKMIFDVYKKGVIFSADTVRVELADADTTNKNFEAEYELVFLKSADSLVKKEISISGIYNIRKSFILGWDNSKYPNILFGWHNLLLQKGYFEAYHYWLFKEANVAEFDKWKAANTAIYTEFENWLPENFLQPSKTNYFVTKHYVSQ